jgi:hypothetical protein
MRHGLRSTVVAVAACALLSGCFGSSSPEPTAAHSGPHKSRASTPVTDATSPVTSPATSVPTTAPTTGSSGGVVPLQFFPKSDGRHSHICYTISGSDPVDFVYYPVVVEPSVAVTLTTAAVTYADGVQVAGAWVAPSAPTRGTGTVQEWPAGPDVTQSASVQWSKRVPAAGASLTPGTWYNVFLHLRVYPDALPLATDGVVLTFTDSSGAHDVTWVDHLTFKTSC